MNKRRHQWWWAAPGLLLIAALTWLLNFDANRLRPPLADWFLANKQRQLHIGKLSWHWYGHPALVAENVRIAERHQPEQTFLSIDRIDFALHLWPLLRQRVVADQLQLHGLKAKLRHQGGAWNFADLLAPSTLIKDIDITQIQLHGGTLHISGESDALTVDLTHLSAAPLRRDTPLALQAAATVTRGVWQSKLETTATLNPGADAWHAVKLRGELREGSGSPISWQLAGALQPGTPLQARDLLLQSQGTLPQPWSLHVIVPRLQCAERCSVDRLQLKADGQYQNVRGDILLDLQQITASRDQAQAQLRAVVSANQREHRGNLRLSGDLAWQHQQVRLNARELELALLPQGIPAGLAFSLPGDMVYALPTQQFAATVNGRCLGSPCQFRLDHLASRQPPWRLEGKLQQLQLPASSGTAPAAPGDVLAAWADLPLAIKLQIGTWRQGDMMLRGLTLESDGR